MKHHYRTRYLLLCLIMLVGATLAQPAQSRASIQMYRAPAPSLPASAPRPADGSYTVYLPFAAQNFPWHSPLGVQSDPRLTGGLPLLRTVDLGAGWARVAAIHWRQVQPTEGGPIDWPKLAGFEQEMRALKQAGITPEVTVLDSPRWATINVPFPTACGAVRADKFGAFASFMRALAERYGAPEFGVHHWELGNEIDVDPSLVAADNGFGCWGNIKDPYYGGRHYGEMLKAVTPAIRAADPAAQIWIGGLLLDNPFTTEPNRGRPELFLQGILAAGAAPYFDIVPYHAYPPYSNAIADPESGFGGPWDSWGGLLIGKANFLRQIMQSYGVDKPLFVNESALMCPDLPPYASWCLPPGPDFYEMQAMYLVRSFTRALSARVEGVLWFTINGPGWRYTGLTDQNYNPTPAYYAFQQYNAQIANSSYARTVDYGAGVEAYEFVKFGQRLHVIWSRQNTTNEIVVPRAQFVSAVDRNGAPLQPFSSNDTFNWFAVGFDPMYITLTP